MQSKKKIELEKSLLRDHPLLGANDNAVTFEWRDEVQINSWTQIPEALEDFEEQRLVRKFPLLVWIFEKIKRPDASLIELENGLKYFGFTCTIIKAPCLVLVLSEGGF